MSDLMLPATKISH